MLKTPDLSQTKNGFLGLLLLKESGQCAGNSTSLFDEIAWTKHLKTLIFNNFDI